jgi:hypothetical protein
VILKLLLGNRLPRGRRVDLPRNLGKLLAGGVGQELPLFVPPIVAGLDAEEHSAGGDGAGDRGERSAEFSGGISDLLPAELCRRRRAAAGTGDAEREVRVEMRGPCCEAEHLAGELKNDR